MHKSNMSTSLKGLQHGRGVFSSFEQLVTPAASHTFTVPAVVMFRWVLLQTIMNAHGVGEVALAGATSNLFAMLAESYRRSKSIKPGDESLFMIPLMR